MTGETLALPVFDIQLPEGRGLLRKPRSLEKTEIPMSFKISSFKLRAALAVGLATATLAISLGSPAGSAATGDKPHHRVHRDRVAYATHRWHGGVQSATLPYGPEYGFLSHVPADAIRGPGYIFVPGVGILGESCDLPTSACPNQYRDVR